MVSITEILRISQNLWSIIMHTFVMKRRADSLRQRSFLVSIRLSYCSCLSVVATYISSSNRVIFAGGSSSFNCYSSDTPPYWHFYSLTPAAKPCGFGNYSLYSGISRCPSATRISVKYSSTQPDRTELTISNAQLSDAGTYTCGGQDPNYLGMTASVIVGVIGMCTLCLSTDGLNLNRRTGN